VKTTKRSQQQLVNLEAFVAEFGHARPPKDYRTPDDSPLGRWVGSRRLRRGKNPELDALLEALPGWEWKTRRPNATVEKNGGWTALTSFVKREGHTNVPALHVERGFPLGNWVGSRRSYRGRNAAIDLRCETYPGWFWGVLDPPNERGSQTERFERWMVDLEAFVREYGHARVPYGYLTPAKKCLSTFVDTSRVIRGRNLERDARLEALPGWEWRPVARTPTKLFFDALDSFAQREGHVHVPLRHVEGDLQLGKWMYQRRSRRGANPEVDKHLETYTGWSWERPRAGHGNAGKPGR
jgi:hypothetical protein